jgi:hypothetical protein
MRLLAAVFVSIFFCAAAEGADLAPDFRDAGLDPAECYRVHDVQINKDDLHFYFTDGYLIFGKPVNGFRTTAVFTTDVEAGDAELLLLPPDRSERRSLATYTGSPNLNEHFSAAVLLFGDDTYDNLMKQIHASEFNRRRPEMGAVMAEDWNSVVKNLSSSFEARLLLDLLSPHQRERGCFIAAVNGKRLGNFDVIYEPRVAEQISVGQVTSRNGLTFFDVWTSFEAGPTRKDLRARPSPEFSVKDYRIQATLAHDLSLRVITKVKVTLSETGKRALPFDITRRMHVLSATIDGVAAEVMQPEALRSNLMRNDGNEMFLLVAPHPLEPGRDHEVEFRHEGAVVEDTGHQVYFVGPRGTWYPNAGTQFSGFDLTFWYPKNLDLVTPGAVVSDTTEADWRVTRRITEAPIRFAGFNLGIYERSRVTRDGYTVEVCANRGLEDALRSRPQAPAAGTDSRPPGRRPGLMRVVPPVTEHPGARLQELASEVASAFEFMASRFGPPPLKTLEVSPIPGGFGQGFPGLVYLSTMSYLSRQDLPMANLDSRQQTFFIDLLQAHETAHQWWGNVVVGAGYHDDWLMESLANYSALLFLEKRQGRQVVDAVLDAYRTQLIAKSETGQTIESTGPIVLGTRLQTSQAPAAWHSITYGKGSWIMHMLRARMGEDRFISMLAELRRRYEWKPLSTDQFRQLAVEFLPPHSADAKLEAFFDQWVYGTGIPSLKLDYSVRGRPPTVKITGAISQSDVDSEFTTEVPVVIQTGKNTQLKWVQTSSSPVPFNVVLRQTPTKVLLDTSNILAMQR